MKALRAIVWFSHGFAAAIALLFIAQTAAAANPPVDRDRAATARALALRYWHDSGLETLPAHYDRARFKNALNGEDDPDVLAAWNDMNTLPTPEGRQKAYVVMQKLVLERVYAIPLGSVTKIQAVRANVGGFVPFRIPRMANVWLEH